MTGGNTSFATGAAVEGDLEGILFTKAGFGQWDQAAVVLGEIGLAAMMDF